MILYVWFLYLYNFGNKYFFIVIVIEIVDYSDEVGASHVGVAPTTFSLST